MTPEQTDGDAQLSSEIQSLLKVASTQLVLRHKYLDTVPWCVVNADSQEGAAAFLKSVASRKLEEHDECTRSIVEVLHSDLKAVAEQGADVISDQLKDCVSEFAESPLDESAGEGYHRSTHHVLMRASGSSDPYVKAAVRVKQNTRILKGYLPFKQGRRILRFEWRKWSRILQTKKRALFQSKKMRPADVLRRVYREDAKALEDWSLICDRVKALGQGDAPKLPKEVKEVRQREELRREYLKATFVPLQWYGVNFPRSEQGEDGQAVEQPETRHFLVLNVIDAHSRPHLMPTIDTHKEVVNSSRLAFQVHHATVAREAVSALSADVEVPGVIVYHEEDPVWLDWKDLAPWEFLYDSLVVFSSVTGVEGQPGRTALSDPVLAKPTFALTDRRCPTLNIVSELLNCGWKEVQQTVHHSSKSKGKVMDGREAARMKTYYLVLLDLQKHVRLAPEGIPSDQPISFYKCLLKGLAGVLPHQGDKTYLRMLKDGAALPAIEDAPGADSGSEEFVVGGADSPVAIEEGSEEVSFAAPRQRIRKKAPPLPPKTVPPTPPAPPPPLPATTTQPLLPPVPPPTVPPTTAPPAPPVEEDFIVAGTPSEPAPPPPPAAPRQPRVIENKSRVKRARKARDWKDAIGGGQIHYEIYAHPDGRPGYGNFQFKCQHLGHDAKCGKVRGSGPAMTRLSPLEPLAFLHAWRDVLEAPERSELDVSCHRDEPPTEEEVQAFLESNGDALKELAERLGYKYESP